MELKNCPFCGSKVRFSGGEEEYNALVEEHGRACLHIHCTNRDCNAQMFVHDSSVLTYQFFEEKAVKQWNRRVADEDEASKEM